MHYYKTEDGKSYMAYKTPRQGYIEISESEWNAHLESMNVPPSEEELAIQEKQSIIAFLKSELTRTDYQAIKYAEGLIPVEDYEPIKAQRQAWRDEINALEGELGL